MDSMDYQRQITPFDTEHQTRVLFRHEVLLGRPLSLAPMPHPISICSYSFLPNYFDLVK